LRCIYCMPADGIKLYKQNEVLSYEEVLKAVKILAELGIKKVRITGGEPLLRENILKLVGSLGKINGIEDISLTTNGILLSKYAEKLKNLGIKRINISLDTLDANKYRKITRGGDLRAVLNSIDRALMIGISNIKINIVISDYLDAKDIEGFISMAFSKPVHVRFIEIMQAPFLKDSIFNIECSSSSFFEVKENKNQFGLKDHNIILKKIFLIIRQLGDFVRVDESIGFGPAVYYKARDSRGSVGFILNDKIYCSACNRLRLSSSGSLQLCLFSDLRLDLREMLRQEKPEEKIKAEITGFVKTKPENREVSCMFNDKVSNGIHKGNNKIIDSFKLKLADYMSKVGG